ncbi:unnamed protein product [Macrosiphum euphorbiae]|uniref:Uncharacterized protein n=1 Tax=Macrosiphum euphorbiae TaxID=13131 RepID=A0AAV0W915_9HEMI|nr:unnamed protein product [Macrosiphum euphorbiae]
METKLLSDNINCESDPQWGGGNGQTLALCVTVQIHPKYFCKGTSKQSLLHCTSQQGIEQRLQQNNVRKNKIGQ